jgi:hypothetical protein
MSRQKIAIMLSCAAVVYACAPRSHVPAENTARKEPPRTATNDSNTLALSVSDANGKKGTTFTLAYRNHGKLTELKFANGRTHDFIVVDSLDREVWRWSEGRLFTQSLQTKQLKNGDAVEFDATWSAAAPGTYRVIASLNTATPAQLEQEFVVR